MKIKWSKGYFNFSCIIQGKRDHNLGVDCDCVEINCDVHFLARSPTSNWVPLKPHCNGDTHQYIYMINILYLLCSSIVKYIREVSPLFKKPSLVADLPWDSIRPQSPTYSGSEDSGSPKHSSSSSSKDRKVISLKMCFISRNLTMPDLENRYDTRLLNVCVDSGEK